jgi:hypothetical protein
MDGTHGTQEKEEKNSSRLLVDSLKQTDHFEDGRIILKSILRKCDWAVWIYSSGSEHEPVDSSCEHRNENSSSIKWCKFLQNLKNS